MSVGGREYDEREFQFFSYLTMCCKTLRNCHGFPRNSFLLCISFWFLCVHFGVMWKVYWGSICPRVMKRFLCTIHRDWGREANKETTPVTSCVQWEGDFDCGLKGHDIQWQFAQCKTHASCWQFKSLSSTATKEEEEEEEVFHLWEGKIIDWGLINFY